MSKKQSSMRLGIGAPSIFMIFVILVICTLAVLSYLRANSYYESTLRQASITSEYYESESRILSRYYQLEITDLQGNQVDFKREDNCYVIEEQINATQILQLSFVQEGNELKIIGLKTVNQEE